MSFSWDPGRYGRYADERGRAFVELLARVGAEEPERVVDLGCGSGGLTLLLHQRWPAASVLGIDSSVEMVAAAPAGRGVAFELGDLTRWDPPSAVDVLVSNAALQWVPGHLDLLPRLVGQVRSGGWLAFQVPGNFGEPSHVVRRQLAAEPPYVDHTGGLPEPAAHDPATYLRTLRDLGCDVDAWESTYLHVLTGPDPVLRWIEGTSARPALEALPDDLQEQFRTELARRLAEAYPVRDGAVVMPFRRVFVVARRGTTTG